MSIHLANIMIHEPVVTPTVVLMTVAYLVGAIPVGVILGRANGVDLQLAGSGLSDDSNVWRTMGFRAFLLVVLANILKGLVPVWAAIAWLQLPPVAVILVGLASILGHGYSPYVRFRGGKVVATSGGVLLALKPLLLLTGVAVWIVIFLRTRVYSVATLSAVTVIALFAVAMHIWSGLPLAYVVLVWLATLLIFWMHRDSIQRLRNGTEQPFSRVSR